MLNIFRKSERIYTQLDFLVLWGLLVEERDAGNLEDRDALKLTFKGKSAICEVSKEATVLLDKWSTLSLRDACKDDFLALTIDQLAFELVEEYGLDWSTEAELVAVQVVTERAVELHYLKPWGKGSFKVDTVESAVARVGNFPTAELAALVEPEIPKQDFLK